MDQVAALGPAQADDWAFARAVMKGLPPAVIAAELGLSLGAVRKRIARLKKHIDVPAPIVTAYGPVPILEAAFDQCRRPLQARYELPSATMRVCGTRTLPGRSWCPACARIVFSRAAAGVTE